jgi:zinc/manganese transport system permease protein
MQDFLRTMTYPFLACLLMAGILVNFGIHVIERQVIFVDLALAQIAAFGAVFGVLLGWDLDRDPWAIRGFSLAFAVLGAAVFSLTRSRRQKVPHEASIGITYAVAFAATILATSRLGHGAEEVDQLLAGSILFVRGRTIVTTGLLYAAVGAIHFALRRRFVRISVDPAGAEREGWNVRAWDFLFYVTFGLVVTSAVSIAGVLLVFSYLVIPAVIAVLFAKRVATRLAIGWAVGALVSMAGVGVSYRADLPSGPAIVVAFAVALVLAGIASTLRDSPTKLRTSLRFAGGGAAALAVVGGSWLLRRDDERELAHFLESPVKSERLMALGTAEQDEASWPTVRPRLERLLRDPEPEVRARVALLAGKRGERGVLPAVHALLRDPDDHVREIAVRVVRGFEDRSSPDALIAAGKREEDEYLKAEFGEALLELGDARGFELLLEVMGEGDAEQARKDAHEHFAAHALVDLPYDSSADDAARAAALARWREWWESRRGKLVQDRATGRFSSQ